MDNFLYYIRDNLVGTHYFMYAFVLLFFSFSIIGYLFKQKYAVYDIKLNKSQDSSKQKNLKKVSNVNKKEENKVENVKTSVNNTVNNAEKSSNENLNIKIENQTESVLLQKDSVANIQVTKPEAKTDAVIPTPMPSSPKVNNPVKIPATGEKIEAKPMENNVSTEVTNSAAVVTPNINKPIPEIK